MYSEPEIKEIFNKIFSLSKAEGTEILYSGFNRSLTRYANNQIHQNVAEVGQDLSIRTMVGRKSGRVSINKTDDQSLKDAVGRAIAMAKSQEDDPNFVPLPGPQKFRNMNVFSQATLGCSPEERADGVIEAIGPCKKKGLIASGAFETAGSYGAYGNSKGSFGYYQATEANFSISAAKGDSTGWSDQTDKDVKAIKPEVLVEKAIEKALMGENPTSLEPGSYTVILEPYCMQSMYFMLAFTTLTAQAIQEKRSYLTDKMGTKVVGENITLVDDAYDPEVIGVPGDAQGIPKKRVVFFDKGIAKEVVYDLVTAAKEGKESTGHGGPLPNSFGPFPANGILMPGNATIEEMIASTERGVYVSRFHYVNIVDPRQVMITGMTRDGTFWIENGKIAYPVKNMRFTQSVIELLNNVEMLENKTKTFGGSRFPGMKAKNFNFTSAATF
jgi:predicted Zn-dependent protease